MEKISGIYEIKNLINGKKYIGQSFDIVTRKHKHFWALKNGRHDNGHLQKSFNKYGENNFIFKIIEECNIKSLTSREQFYVDNEDRENLYNICIECVDSILGVKRSDETREKMSVAAKGRKKSAETIAKISVALKGRTLSAEHKAKLSLAHSGKNASKLTWNDVHFIREHKKMTRKILAKKFAVSVRTIYFVITNHTWKE